MNTKRSTYPFLIAALGIFMTAIGCNKENAFLNTKPNQALETLTSLSDLQALLDDEDVFNRNCDPALGELSSDDFYIQDVTFSSITNPLERNAYLWAQSIYSATNIQVSDWNAPYQMVYYANTVLDALPKVPDNNNSQYRSIKGSALFYRSFAFYNLVQVFAMPFDSTAATTQPGIPLRLTSDLNVKCQRASEADCYNQILADLKTALPLLPVSLAYVTQPSQPAANALLARIYLGMGNYPLALQYANACLNQFSTLTDFNSLTTPTTTSLSTGYLSEDMYHSSMINYTTLAVRRNTVVDSGLYNSYDNNDLRKTKFFAILDGLPQYPRFVGSYDFKGNKFDGLATDEVYLIKAECLARSGDFQDAMTVLNALLITRWTTSTFVPYTAANANEALIRILAERRKELIYRGTRWTDLRRLNKETGFAISLERNLNGTIYTLPPNDLRYALPIPDNEIQLSGLIQNQR